MASSLCLGWIADGKDFDSRRQEADRLLQGGPPPVGGRVVSPVALPERLRGLEHPRRRSVAMGGGDVSKHQRPYTEWVATHNHRPDLNEGCSVAFRRSRQPLQQCQVSLRGIDPTATYEVSWDSKGRQDNKMLPGSETYPRIRDCPARETQFRPDCLSQGCNVLAEGEAP